MTSALPNSSSLSPHQFAQYLLLKENQREGYLYRQASQNYAVYFKAKHDAEITQQGNTPLTLREITELGNQFLDELSSHKNVDEIIVRFKQMGDQKYSKESRRFFITRLVCIIWHCFINFIRGRGFKSCAAHSIELSEKLAMSKKNVLVEPIVKTNIKKEILVPEPPPKIIIQSENLPIDGHEQKVQEVEDVKIEEEIDEGSHVSDSGFSDVEYLTDEELLSPKRIIPINKADIFIQSFENSSLDSISLELPTPELIREVIVKSNKELCEKIVGWLLDKSSFHVELMRSILFAIHDRRIQNLDFSGSAIQDLMDYYLESAWNQVEDYDNDAPYLASNHSLIVEMSTLLLTHSPSPEQLFNLIKWMMKQQEYDLETCKSWVMLIYGENHTVSEKVIDTLWKPASEIILLDIFKNHPVWFDKLKKLENEDGSTHKAATFLIDYTRHNAFNKVIKKTYEKPIYIPTYVEIEKLVSSKDDFSINNTQRKEKVIAPQKEKRRSLFDMKSIDVDDTSLMGEFAHDLKNSTIGKVERAVEDITDWVTHKTTVPSKGNPTIQVGRTYSKDKALIGLKEDKISPWEWNIVYKEIRFIDGDKVDSLSDKRSLENDPSISFTGLLQEVSGAKTYKKIDLNSPVVVRVINRFFDVCTFHQGLELVQWMKTEATQVDNYKKNYPKMKELL